MAAKAAANRRWQGRKRESGFAGYAHGETRTYRAGCRCDQCRSANTAYHRQYLIGRAELEHSHGSKELYRAGCRCDKCEAEAFEHGIVDFWDPHEPPPRRYRSIDDVWDDDDDWYWTGELPPGPEPEREEEPPLDLEAGPGEDDF